MLCESYLNKAVILKNITMQPPAVTWRMLTARWAPSLSSRQNSTKSWPGHSAAAPLLSFLGFDLLHLTKSTWLALPSKASLTVTGFYSNQPVEAAVRAGCSGSQRASPDPCPLLPLSCGTEENRGEWAGEGLEEKVKSTMWSRLQGKLSLRVWVWFKRGPRRHGKKLEMRNRK